MRRPSSVALIQSSFRRSPGWIVGISRASDAYAHYLRHHSDLEFLVDSGLLQCGIRSVAGLQIVVDSEADSRYRAMPYLMVALALAKEIASVLFENLLSWLVSPATQATPLRGTRSRLCC